MLQISLFARQLNFELQIVFLQKVVGGRTLVFVSPLSLGTGKETAIAIGQEAKSIGLGIFVDLPHFVTAPEKGRHEQH